MAHKITCTIEVLDADHRDTVLAALAEALAAHHITTRTFTISYEEQTPRGKKLIRETIEFAPGEDIELTEMGVSPERPLEAALRALGGTTISAGGRSVTVQAPKRQQASKRPWADDEFVIREERSE